MKDLFVLTADADMEAAMKTLLSARHRALGIRSIEFTVERHTQRDAGCRRRAADRLRGYTRDHAYALVMFDRDGSGDPSPREEIQTSVDAQLSDAGWPDRSKTIVIDPELEAWIWGSSPHVARLLGWQTNEALRSWLRERELWPITEAKPPDPNAAAVVPSQSRIYRSRLVSVSDGRNTSEPNGSRHSHGTSLADPSDQIRSSAKSADGFASRSIERVECVDEGFVV